MAKVEFVKYTGDWPCYCGGTLHVKIDGKNIAFGGSNKGRTTLKGKSVIKYPEFWKSGGTADWYDDGFIQEEMIGQGPWKFNIGPWNEKSYPEDILRNMDELLRIMNENVEWGCCGGCL